MIYKIRVVLDIKQDVIRTIAIEGSKTLEDLHNTITQAFGFNGQQMASFYRTDDDWNQGEEIPLISMDDSPNALSMKTTSIDQNIEDIGEKLIYVYDFLNMWTFFVELIETNITVEGALPKIILSIGDVPEEAPEKEFKADAVTNDEDPYGLDGFGNPDGFDSFENIDDIDFDNY
ncbi:MAG: IS1096 element passenger TnpR family protein [Flavicella sp.]